MATARENSISCSLNARSVTCLNVPYTLRMNGSRLMTRSTNDMAMRPTRAAMNLPSR